MLTSYITKPIRLQFNKFTSGEKRCHRKCERDRRSDRQKELSGIDMLDMQTCPGAICPVLDNYMYIEILKVTSIFSRSKEHIFTYHIT